MNEFDQLVRRHLDLQAQVARDPGGVNLADVEQLLAETRAAGRQVAAVDQREHLRAILRYWGAFVYEKTSEYPATQLAPYGGLAEAEAESALESVDATPPSLPVNMSTGSTVLEGMPVARPVARPQAPSRPGYLANPLFWLILLALGAIALLVLIISLLLPVFRSGTSSSPAPGAETGIPSEVLDPDFIEGETAVINVTRASETESPGVDLIMTVRPGATLQELAADLQTNLETLQSLNPSLSVLPSNGTLLILVGQPVEDAELVVTSSQASAYDQPAQRGQVLIVLPGGTFAAVLGRTSDYQWYWVDTGNSRGWLADQDIGLIYPTVPDGLPIVARVQLVTGTPTNQEE